MPAGSTDVAIVGAGPTGLLAAALLARSGVAVRILDQESGPAKESRAFAVQARTLEVMASIGLADRFFERGLLASGARIHVDGKLAGGFGLDFAGRTDTPFPVVMILPQSETERILVEHLSGLGIAVERGIRVETVSQDETGVDLAGRDSGGAAFRLRASWAVGADGAHSVVRKALGLSFAGAPYAQGFLLADCRVDGDYEEGPFSVFFHGHDFALFFPIRGERFGRVITTDGAPAGEAAGARQGSAPATLDEVEASFRRATQRDVRLSRATWTSRYRVHHRGVDRYRVGRVFVAGDAAHIHSPAGGQGMNTGLQDAANLAWKLALAVKGGAPPALLDSYDAERRPVGEHVLAATDRAFSFLTSSSGLVAALRDVALPLVGSTIGRSGALRSRAFGFLSQLGVRYEPGAAAAEDQPGWGAGPAPGRRAPDARIGRRVGVFDRIAGYRFHLLALSRRPLGEEAIGRMADGLDALAARSGLDPATTLAARSLVGRHPRIVQVEDDAVLDAYGVTGDVLDALYLLRPDGHVAWRAASFDTEGCRAFIAARFAGAVTNPSAS